MTLLKNAQQREISAQMPMPVDNVGSDAIYSVSGETVQLYYYNAGVYTIDAGQAAGVVVTGKLLYRNIRNANGDMAGTHQDTSLSFTSTAFTTEVAFPYGVKEQYSDLTGTARAAAITSGFSNGDYCVDYRTGALYGVKADNSVTLTNAAYKVETAASGGAGPSSDVNLVKVAGTATAAGAGAVTGGTLRTTLASDDPAVALLGTIDADTGAIKTATELIDDAVHADEAAFTTGTDKGIAVEGLYEAAGSNVADGQVGALAMTIDRHVIVQDEVKDSGTNSNVVFEASPLNLQYLPSSDVLTNVVNITPRYIYYNMSGYRYITMEIAAVDAGGGDIHTITLEGTCQDDGTAAAPCAYQDVTASLLGVASTATATTWIIDTPVAFKYLRIKDTTAGGNNNGGITVYSKRMY